MFYAGTGYAGLVYDLWRFVVRSELVTGRSSVYDVLDLWCFVVTSKLVMGKSLVYDVLDLRRLIVMSELVLGWFSVYDDFDLRCVVFGLQPKEFCCFTSEVVTWNYFTT